ncbi:ABC transporter [Nocardia nova]|uniref:ABC transporter n=2 Tax=Nocardia nova TaxID=37330 RepID=A0A2S6AKI3_9NOCA|nr:ABC transporter [Nocardia nova]
MKVPASRSSTPNTVCPQQGRGGRRNSTTSVRSPAPGRADRDRVRLAHPHSRRYPASPARHLRKVFGMTAPPPSLVFGNISKSFGSTRALKQVSFEIPHNTVHALCGGNGSGKSTLIKILAGVYQADSGVIAVDGDRHDASKTSPGWATHAGLHFVHQATGTFPDLTVAENFAMGSAFGVRGLRPIPWTALNRKVRSVLDRFEIDVSPGARIGELSPAAQTMVAVARALQDEESSGRGALILDEPTASLTTREVDEVLDAIRGYRIRGHTVIFVTHRLGEILEVADGVTFLRDGIHQETVRARNLTEQYLIERITGESYCGRSVKEAVRATEVCLSLRNYSVGPVKRANIKVGKGEIVGISGLLGSGRSTLLRSLFGMVSITSGVAEFGGKPLAPRSPLEAIRRGVVYIPEDRPGMASFPELTVRENLSCSNLARYWSGICMKRGRERRAVAAALDMYGVVTSSTETAFSNLSGGNQQKVVLARWMELGPQLMLLDEPSQGVDVGARRSIHERIMAGAREGVSVLVVSSDPQELAELCDRVVGLHNGQVVGEVSGVNLTPARCAELAHGIVGSQAHSPSFT